MIDSLEWIPCSDDAARVLAVEILGVDQGNPLPNIEIVGKVAPLPSYRRWRLVDLQCRARSNEGPTEHLFALWREGRPPLLLDGKPNALLLANEDESLILDAATVADYLRLFCFAVRGDEGPFILFEKAMLPVTPGTEEVAKLAQRLAVRADKQDGNFLVDATMVYAGNVFLAVLLVEPGGAVTMVDDNPVMQAVPLEAIPSLPGLGVGATLRAQLSAIPTTPTVKRPPGSAAVPPRSTRPALTELVELLLDRSLRALSHNRLIEHFNATVPTAAALEQFAALMTGASPIVVVETDLPFVEETIAEVVCGIAKTGSSLRICRANVANDDSPITFDLPSSGPALVLFPLQVYRSVAQVERVAFDIATRDLGAIITCERFEQLPECLRRLKDIVLRLPVVDVAIFESLFGRIMGGPLVLDWQVGGTAWIKHVLHTDFEHPRRMGLAVDAALDFIRSQVTERLCAVDSAQGLRLSELQGLGEARQFAEDLIADIHAAISGKLPWSQVDRGALLVGPPGTGKTTLARAIAKDCGVRFLTASPTGWQADGVSLGPHIAAIRRTFSEARRYAPSILFIDEIDSIGNREDFGGTNNSVYQTEVVNTLLEQMQGLDPAAPVFVIAATNLEERVDPALRRAGRLDRVIRIPRPNSESLDLIYRHYIGLHAASVGTDPGVDTVALGRLSVGLTGADVERVVRGAVRRARKSSRPLAHNDVIAEITNKPRDSTSSMRLTPEELERTAVHEAGHALAHFLGSSGGSRIGFVTVIPRDDGTLGFVASMPDDRVHLTRRDFEDNLDVLLAGRAAESLRYGEDMVSSGASSDLKSATMLVEQMVTKLGLGGRRRLLWLESMSAADLELAEETLRQSHDRVLARLKDNEALLLRLAKELIARQELSGDEVRDILSGR